MDGEFIEFLPEILYALSSCFGCLQCPCERFSVQQPENTNTDGKLALLTRVPTHPTFGTLACSRYADCGPGSDVFGRPETSESGPQSAYRERAKVPRDGCGGTLVNRASFPSVLVFSGCCTENRSHGQWRPPTQDETLHRT